MVTRFRQGTPVFRSLSARLLVLTIGFVMLGEVLIYAPSVAQFRMSYLEERISNAHLATLTLEAMPDHNIGAALQRRVLDRAGVHHVVLRTNRRHTFALGAEIPPPIDATYDFSHTSLLDWVGDAAVTLFHTRNRILRVIAPSPHDPATTVEILIDEAPLRQAMIAFSWRVLAVSLLISVIAAGLVYLSLQWLMVRPLRRITGSMTAFRADPEDPSAGLPSTLRADEIGLAQRELARMQVEVRRALGERRRLAALGGAVAKINHDLRNSLSTAVLASDRLTHSEDANVRRLAERLLGALDRAVQLCAQTLDFAREGGPRLEISTFGLRRLADEVGAGIAESGALDGAAWRNEVGSDVTLEGDREQIFRALSNLCINALQAGATEVSLGAESRDGYLCLHVSDNGPGLSELAKRNLFMPFTGSTKSGGTGLGLVIARDVMHAHGGDILLARTGAEGTTFLLEFPLHPAPDLTAGAGHDKAPN